MEMIPIFRCANMKEAIIFYTRVLDFELKDASPDDLVVILANGEAKLMLSTIDGAIANAANVLVDHIDALFQKYISRGLDITHKKDSPVHQGPLNQTWGTREFYVTDADKNTLRFCQPVT